MKFAIYSSGKGTRMRKAIENGKEEFVSDIKIFFTEDPETKYLEPFLNSKGIKYILVPYESSIEKEKARENFSNAFLRILHDNDIDYVFCNGRHILKGAILEKYKNRIINFHGALLPAYRGSKMLDKMLDKREFLLGTTAMFIDEGIDTGPIIMEAIIPAKAFYDAENGYDVILDTQIYMMYKIYDLLKAGRIKMVGNDVEISGGKYDSFFIFPQV